jgi:lipooligosaccharide transport system permease protein
MRIPGDIDLGLATAVWRRNLTVYRHTWMMNVLPNFFEPLLYLLGLGVGLGFYIGDGFGGPADYLVFIAPGLMAAAAMNGASFETTYNMFVKMNFAKLYDAYLSTPCQLQDIAFGELMWAVTRALIYGIGFLVVLGGFTAAGYPILQGWGVLLLPPALALVGAVFALIGQLFTSLVRVIDLYSYYFTLWLTPLFLFSGIFFPVDRFPGGPEIAWFTPLYHGVRLVRGLSQSQLGGAELVSVAWLAVVALALMAVVPRAMRRRMIT